MIKNFLQKHQEFQTKKYLWMAGMILAGLAAAVCAHLSSRMQGRLEEGTRLYRNEWDGGSYSVTLRAITQEGEGEIDYEIKERVLTEKEIAALKAEAETLLPEIIRGNNESLKAVRENLNLVTAISGLPFVIAWQSSDYRRIRTDGRVDTEDLPKEGMEVYLTAVLSYGKQAWTEEMTVRLLPAAFTWEEQYLSDVNRVISENDSLYQESHEILLPDKIGKEAVIWEEKRKDGSFLFLITGFLAALTVPLLMERNLKQKKKQRTEELIRSYPGFVSKLQLYMGAGLTVKNAFLRIGREYQEEKARTGKKKFLYEELLISICQFRNGKPEGEVYREWGQRCDEMRYRKLSFLLTSHLRQGNDKLLSMLSAEAETALEERKSRAKRQGEEAGTKLLLPMMMMLVMVMLLILLPVFSGFGTI